MQAELASYARLLPVCLLQDFLKGIMPSGWSTMGRKVEFAGTAELCSVLVTVLTV
jgi:hypothetical protein